LTAAQIMLLLDRFLGAHFFDTQAGGSATLWMHFFWIFGHPEVYILVLPGFAFASEQNTKKKKERNRERKRKMKTPWIKRKRTSAPQER